MEMRRLEGIEREGVTKAKTALVRGSLRGVRGDIEDDSTDLMASQSLFRVGIHSNELAGARKRLAVETAGWAVGSKAARGRRTPYGCCPNERRRVEKEARPRQDAVAGRSEPRPYKEEERWAPGGR